MQIYTKESMTQALRDIRRMGWVKSSRPGNAGAVGNTLEDLLGIPENNLPIPNAREWELKCQRAASGSLTTLFHMEPSPRALRLVPQVLLPKYGWPHETLPEEKSFRQTISAVSRTDRGFALVLDRPGQKLVVSFDAASVDRRHSEWLQSVAERVGLGELNPQPYWGLEDLRCKAGTKLPNCFYVQASCRRVGGAEYFSYEKILILEEFNFDRFLDAVERGTILVDFDARTGHNHGTKFRLRQGSLPELYASVCEV